MNSATHSLCFLQIVRMSTGFLMNSTFSLTLLIYEKSFDGRFKAYSPIKQLGSEVQVKNLHLFPYKKSSSSFYEFSFYFSCTFNDFLSK